MLTLTQGDGRSTAAPVKRSARWWVEVVESLEALAPCTAAWDDLAWNSIEPNPFYESWMFLAGWRAFGAQERLRIALIYRDGARPQDPAELCGFVPLCLRRHEKLPVQTWSLWHNQYGFLCTPLLRQGVATEAWRTFCGWLSEQRPALLELPLVSADSAFQQTFVEVANERRTPWLIEHQYARALLKPAEDAAAYCDQTMTCHNRQELRRQRRRLGERGRLDVRVTQPGADWNAWINDFLSLEAAGWKGREQTAFAASERDADYLREVVTAAAARNQVAMLGMFLDDRPIALKLNFLAADGGFTFKIAFDEELRKFSPGVLLELENIDWFHQQRGLAWLDSCARPDHFMIGRLWKDRRLMQRVLMSTGSRRGDLLVGVCAMGKAFRSALRKRGQPSTDTSTSPAAPAKKSSGP